MDAGFWLDGGGTVDELRHLAAAAPAYEPQDDAEEPEEWPEPEPLSDESRSRSRSMRCRRASPPPWSSIRHAVASRWKWWPLPRSPP